MGKILIVGVGPGERDWMLPAAVRAMSSAVMVLAAKRHEHLVPPNANIYVMNKMAEAFDEAERALQTGDVAICCSGDPGVYSLLRSVRKRFPFAEMQVISGIGSLQMLSDRLCEGRENAVIISAHGRQLTEAKLIGTVAYNEQTLILLDDERNAEWLCRTLQLYGLDKVEIAVGENLSYPSQRVVVGSPTALLKETFSALAVARVLNTSPNRRTATFGLADEEFVRGEAPMTRSEVRALALSKLRLEPDSVVWDIGAGTGSVSVEAARLCCGGMVCAIEREPKALSLIEENKRRFRVSNVRIFEGEAQRLLLELPKPTHVFIGASGGELPELLSQIAGLGGRIRVVTAAATIEAQALAFAVMSKPPFKDVEGVQAGVSSLKKTGGYSVWNAHNPITLISAWTEGK